MLNNSKNISVMQLSLFDLAQLVGASVATTASKKETSASAFTTSVKDCEVSWGDIYSEYEDFSVCSKKW